MRVGISGKETTMSVARCTHMECQHVDENPPPCPRHTGMYTEEIKAAEAARSPWHDQEDRPGS